MTTPVDAPPRLPERLLERALAGSPFRDDIVGDLHEAYGGVATRRGRLAARWWYCGQAARLGARYIVRRAFAIGAPRNEIHRSRGDTLMDRLTIDLRYAVRALVKQRVTTATIVVTLALGIGANAAVFGVVDALLLHPFAMADVDRIVMPMTSSPRITGHRETVSPADFLDWRRDLHGGAIEHLAAMDWWDANLVGRDEPERALGMFVSPEFFAALDVHAALGRTFLPEEELPANAKRIVLSDGLWSRRFGSDPAIVGRTALIDGAQWMVVGVMPAGFEFPMRAQLWAPLAFEEATARNRSNHYLTVVGRLALGRTLDEGRAQMTAIAQRLAHEHPDTNAELRAQVLTLSRGMADVGLPQVLALWQAAGLFVLLIACANIANLLLARAAEREREVAIRLAVGSSRGRIVGQSLLESAILVAVSVPLALAVASASLRLMHAFMPARIVAYIAGWDRLGLDSWTIAATLACAALATVLFGVVPAAHIARGVVADALKSDGRVGAGPGRQRVRRALVVAEIALALPLLVAAVLSVSTITQFLTGWQGYDPNNVLTMRVVLPQARYPDADSRRRFVSAVLDGLRSMPGAEVAAVGNVVPAIDSNSVRLFEIAGRPIPEQAKWPRADYRTVSERYFDALRMPILAGRAFGAADQQSSEPVVIVSEMMARKFWPSASAIGERIRLVNGPWMRVVGVCGDVVHDWFDGRVATMYLPIAQAPSEALVFAIRTRGDPLSVVSAARAAVAHVDAMQPVYEVMTHRQVLRERTISLQYIASVMGAFAGLALLLSILGLYAVMSYLVAQRVREIGVRIALGATSADVTRLTLGQAARLTAIGVAIGLMLAVALSRAMEAGLLGVVSADIRTTIALAAALGAVALAASYLPARRAASVDPIVALRGD